MKQFLFPIISLFFFTCASAQLHPSKPSITHHYTGVIGGKYKFLMNLYFDKDSIEGEYRYYTQKDFLKVKGTYNTTTKKFNLVEFYYDFKKEQVQTTGYFEGTRDGNQVTGKWFNKDRTKTFDFVLSTDEKPQMFKITDNSKEDGDQLVTDTISVVFQNGTRQIITGFESQVQEEVDFLNLEDINFDGYLDLLVLEFTGARNTPYLYWVYDPSTGKFVFHQELEATDPVFDVQTKQVISDYSISAAQYGQDKYIYQDSKFYLVERKETDLSTNKTTVTKYKIENGKSVKL